MEAINDMRQNIAKNRRKWTSQYTYLQYSIVFLCCRKCLFNLNINIRIVVFSPSLQILFSPGHPAGQQRMWKHTRWYTEILSAARCCCFKKVAFNTVNDEREIKNINVRKDLKHAQMSSDGIKASLKVDYAHCVMEISSFPFFNHIVFGASLIFKAGKLLLTSQFQSDKM